MKKLGIVLPTYNRCTFSKECVDIILPQLLRNNKDVCLLILDNASTDKTEEMLRPYSEKYPEWVTYFRHNKNIGPHANFYYGINNVDAEYVYLLGDDDIISDVFILKILELIDSNQGVALIHFNYLLGASNLTKVQLYNKEIYDSLLVKYYKDAGTFIREHLVGPSFMSSIVFKRESMLKGMSLGIHEDCYGYDWLLCLFMGIQDESALYYKMPIVIQRCGDVYRDHVKNTIIGQTKLFYYLDVYYPGILLVWTKTQNDCRYYNVFKVLSSISNDRHYYLKLKKELLDSIDNKYYSIAIYSCLYLNKFFSRIFILCLEVLYLFKSHAYRNRILRR